MTTTRERAMIAIILTLATIAAWLVVIAAQTAH